MGYLSPVYKGSSSDQRQPFALEIIYTQAFLLLTLHSASWDQSLKNTFCLAQLLCSVLILSTLLFLPTK